MAQQTSSNYVYDVLNPFIAFNLSVPKSVKVVTSFECVYWEKKGTLWSLQSLERTRKDTIQKAGSYGSSGSSGSSGCNGYNGYNGSNQCHIPLRIFYDVCCPLHAFSCPLKWSGLTMSLTVENEDSLYSLHNSVSNSPKFS